MYSAKQFIRANPRSNTSLRCAALVAGIAVAAALTCNTTPTPDPIPGATIPTIGVVFQLDNQSGLTVSVAGTFTLGAEEVRSTVRRLEPSGAESQETIFRTLTDRVSVAATVAPVQVNPLPDGVQSGQLIITRDFVLGADFADGDTVVVVIPAIPPTPDPLPDCDGNGLADAEEIAANPDLDCDANGVLDICETDTDGDGTIDPCDACPTDATKTQSGFCGCGLPEIDSDGDGTPDCRDGCANDPLKTNPGACGCGQSDVDSDGDGLPDCLDGCPNDATKFNPGACGCGVADADSDGDGTLDCFDACPNDPLKVDPGACGCNVLETDSDGDGTPDCNDGCPDDPGKIDPGVCGCGISDVDSDNDGTPDCNDNCPGDPLKTETGICGCGISDVDSDMDGTADCFDKCPNDPLKIDEGICGCGVIEDIGDDDQDGVPNCLDVCPGGNDNMDCNANGVPDFCDLSARVYWTENPQGSRACNQPVEGAGGGQSGRVRSAFADTGCGIRTHRPSEFGPGEIDIDLTSGMQRMHWTNVCTIDGANLSGLNGATTTPLNQNAFGGLAVDRATRHLYWTELEFNKCDGTWLYRVDLASPTAQAEAVHSICGAPNGGVAVDTTLDIVLWSQGPCCGDGSSLLIKADPNDPQADPVTIHDTDFATIRGVAIDPTTQSVYWLEQVFEKCDGIIETHIRRSDFDGNIIGPDPLINVPGFLGDHIALDFSTQPPGIYWTVPDAGKIMRADLDGGNVDTGFITGLSRVSGIAIRPPGIPNPPPPPTD